MTPDQVRRAAELLQRREKIVMARRFMVERGCRSLTLSGTATRESYTDTAEIDVPLAAGFPLIDTLLAAIDADLVALGVAE